MSSNRLIRQLIIFELRHSKWHLLLLFGLLIGLIFLRLTTPYKTVEQVMTDFSTPAFLFILVLFIITIRPKIFRSQHLTYNFRACEHLVHLQQLPIKKATIVKYRLLANYILLIPILTIYLTTLYIIIDPLQQLLPLGSFIAFSIMLLAAGVMVLNIQTITDFGTNILFSYIYLIFIFMPIIITTIIIFHIAIDQSLFEIMVFLTNNYSIMSGVISALMMIITTYISYRWCLRRMRNIDYLR